MKRYPTRADRQRRSELFARYVRMCHPTAQPDWSGHHWSLEYDFDLTKEIPTFNYILTLNGKPFVGLPGLPRPDWLSADGLSD